MQKKQQGFTLVEVAISLIILGALLTPLLVLYNQYRVKEDTIKTYKNVQNAIFAIEEFREMTGRYPRPAGLNLQKADNIAYGSEVDPALLPTPLVPGQCVGGVCVEGTVRNDAAYIDPATGVPPADRNVLVGMIPFRQLQIDEKEASDAYGNRLVYAITENMTRPGITINDNAGAIDVRSPNGTSLVEPAGSVPFLILSNGRTRNGAYDSYGTLVGACANASAAEQQNCNAGFENPAAGETQAIYVSAFQNNNTAGATYDDVIQFFSGRSEPFWSSNGLNSGDISDKAPGNIGINNTNPSVTLEIDDENAGTFSDSLSIFGTDGTDGILYVDLICNEDGENCFEPGAIGGSVAMECPDDTFMVGIANGGPICNPKVTINCPPEAPVFKGLDNDGNPLCAGSPQNSCLATTRTYCDGTPLASTQIPQGEHGDTQTLNQGSCATATFECRNGDWEIIGGSWAGQCTYAGATETRTTGLDCGPGREGTYTKITKTTGCDGSIITITTKEDDEDRPTDEPADCSCINDSQTITKDCKWAGDNGWGDEYKALNGTVEVTLNYHDNCTTSWDKSKVVEDNCNCPGPTKGETDRRHTPENATCGQGQKNVDDTWFEDWEWDEPSCQYKYKESIEGQCECNLSDTTHREEVDCVGETNDPRYQLPKCWQRTFAEYHKKVVSLDGTTEVNKGSPTECRYETPEEFKNARPPIDPGSCELKPYAYSGELKGPYNKEAGRPGRYNTVGEPCGCTQDGDASPYTCFNADVSFSGTTTPLLYKCKCIPR